MRCKQLLYSIQKKRSRINNEQKTRIYFSPNKKKRLHFLKRFKELIYLSHLFQISCYILIYKHTTLCF